MVVELRAKFFAALCEGGEARRRDLAQLLGVAGELGDAFAYLLAHRADLAVAGLAELVEPVEAVDHLLKLGMRGAAGVGDVVGDVLGGAGDHRQLAAQPFHVFQRRRADRADPFDLRAVLLDQALEAVGVARQAIGRQAAERIEVAALRGKKLARQAELAVDRHQPLFQPARFVGEQARRLAEARGLAPAVAQRDQPDHADQQHGERPARYPGDPAIRGGGREHFGADSPDEEGGPGGDDRRGGDRGDPVPRPRRPRGFGLGIVPGNAGEVLFLLDERRRRLFQWPLTGVGGVFRADRDDV